jgi:hypothetical protein
MFNLDPSALLVSLVWGSVGSGLLLYGKKRVSAPAIIGGLALIGVTFFITSPLTLSLIGVAVVAAAVYATRLGY